MLKSYSELYKLDISKHTSKKPTFKYDKALQKLVETDKKLDYVSWADALFLLYENGAEVVKYGNLYSASGHSLFLVEGGLPEVHIFVEIDGDRRELCYPVIDGATDVKMEKIAQSDIHNATQRAFVKCVAVNWGLGLSLWQKEEKETPIKAGEDLSVHSIYAIKRRIEEKLTSKIQRGMSQEDVLSGVNRNRKQFEMFMSSFKAIDEIERALDAL